MLEDIAQKAAEYRGLVSSVRAKVKAEVMAQVEAKVLEQTEEERVELSKMLHAAHASGIPIAQLRVTTGAYANAQVWNPLWSAFTPDVHTDLRSRRKKVEEKVLDEVTVDDDTVTVRIEDVPYVFTGVTVEDGLVTSFEPPDGVDVGSPVYTQAWQMMNKFFKEE